jgi:hypothetical protein
MADVCRVVVHFAGKQSLVLVHPAPMTIALVRSEAEKALLGGDGCQALVFEYMDEDNDFIRVERCDHLGRPPTRFALGRARSLCFYIHAHHAK